MKKLERRDFLSSIPLFSKSKLQLLKKIQTLVDKNKSPLLIFTPNSEQIVLAHDQKSFAQALGKADFLVPDGIGLVWARRLLAWKGLADPILERITGVDLVTDLLDLAKERDWSTLVVGGRGYNGDDDTGIIQLGKDGQKVFWTAGYRDVASPKASEEKELESILTQRRPGLVLVALGAPHQEKWVIEHRQLLQDSGVAVAMVVGGAVDILTGRLKRAPWWARKLGGEWLYRLWQEPWRWRRQARLVRFLRILGKSLF